MEKTNRHFQFSERTYIGAIVVLIAIVVLVISYFELRARTGH